MDLEKTFVYRKPPNGGLPSKMGRGAKGAQALGTVERGDHIAAKPINSSEFQKRCVWALVRSDADLDKAVAMSVTATIGIERLLPHKFIKYAKWYVGGNTHALTTEDIWNLMVPGKFGQSHSLSWNYLQRYVGEFRCRFNLSCVEDMHRFTPHIDRGLGVVK